jgi:hypothetical protein
MELSFTKPENRGLPRVTGLKKVSYATRSGNWSKILASLKHLGLEIFSPVSML